MKVKNALSALRTGILSFVFAFFLSLLVLAVLLMIPVFAAILLAFSWNPRQDREKLRQLSGLEEEKYCPFGAVASSHTQANKGGEKCAGYCMTSGA